MLFEHLTFAVGPHRGCQAWNIVLRFTLTLFEEMSGRRRDNRHIEKL